MEQLAAGNNPIDLTGLTNYILSVANDTSDQARQAMLPFTGALSGDCTVTIPAIARIGWATNNTSGGHNVILTTGGTVNLTITPGASFLYTTDGSAVSAVTLTAAGVLTAAGGVSVGNGALYAANDTAGVSRPLMALDTANYVSLYAGSAGWRLVTQDGKTALFTLTTGGVGAFGGGLNVNGPLAVGGTLGAGATQVTDLTVTGTARFATPPTFASGTATYAGGVIATGADAGGMQFRIESGSYGAGWRSDGAALYLLLTNSGQQAGTFNGLRPFTVTLSTGVVVLDATGAGAATGGAFTVSGALTVSGIASIAGVSFTGSGYIKAPLGLEMANGHSLNAADAGGTVRPLLALGTDNWTNLYNAGGAGWRVINQAGSSALVTVDAAGNLATLGGLTGTTLALSGNAVINGNGVIGGTLNIGGGIAGAAGSWSGQHVFGVTAYFQGSTGYSGTGMVVANNGVLGPGTILAGASPVSLIASNGVGAAAFYATSDRRLKDDIADITATDAYDWLRRARPRTYTMAGTARAGFIAQEDIEAGRGAAVQMMPDEDPLFAESDGFAPPGVRLSRNYEHDIAYLTAALNGALARIEALEAQAA